MKKIILFLLFLPQFLFSQTSPEKSKCVWIGTAFNWNIPQDLFGFDVTTTIETKLRENKYWNNFLSIGAVYGHKLFESGLFSELPENRIESEMTLNVLLGRGHHFENSILLFKAGLSLNNMVWRGLETGSTCNAFFCLGKYHTFSYEDIIQPGFCMEAEETWRISKHFGMGVAVYSQVHPSYGIISSPFNNNYFEGGVSLYLFNFGRFEN